MAMTEDDIRKEHETVEGAKSDSREFAVLYEKYFDRIFFFLLRHTDDEEAAGVMRACEVDLGALRTTLTNYVDTELRSLVVDDGEDAKPTAGFQRVIQRAVIHVQSSGREEVTGANVLVAIFSERESHAAYFLQEIGRAHV